MLIDSICEAAHRVVYLIHVSCTLNHLDLVRLRNCSFVLYFLFYQCHLLLVQRLQLDLDIINSLFNLFIVLVKLVVSSVPLYCQGVFSLTGQRFDLVIFLLICCFEVLPNVSQRFELKCVKKLDNACFVPVDFDSVLLVAVQGHLIISPTGLIQNGLAGREHSLRITAL